MQTGVELVRNHPEEASQYLEALGEHLRQLQLEMDDPENEAWDWEYNAAINGIEDRTRLMNVLITFSQEPWVDRFQESQPDPSEEDDEPSLRPPSDEDSRRRR